MTETERVIALRQAGVTYRRITEQTGVTSASIARIVRNARETGQMDARELSDTVHARKHRMREVYNLRIGYMPDVYADMPRDQFEWLCEAAQEVGCETLAEYLVELARDEHAREMERLAKRDPLG